VSLERKPVPEDITRIPGISDRSRMMLSVTPSEINSASGLWLRLLKGKIAIVWISFEGCEVKYIKTPRAARIATIRAIQIFAEIGEPVLAGIRLVAVDRFIKAN